MKTDLFFRLTEATPWPSVFFRESAEVEGTVQELRQANVAVFEIDGGALSSEEELFRAFATALRMPKGWYGDEEYACNPNAFLEYLDDGTEWVPAKGHVVLIRGSEKLWRASAHLTGELTELWEAATLYRRASIRLVFVR